MSLSRDLFLTVMREKLASERSVAGVVKAQMLLERLIPEQRDLVADPARFKVVLCPRRAGKSWALAAYLLITCLTVPRANCLFIAQTRERAKDILWEIIKLINKELGLGIRFSEVYLSGRLPGGAKFRLSGCETRADIEKYRGEAYHLVLLDECASHSPELLEALISRALEPALADHKGTLLLAGTPGHVLSGPFYKWTGDPAFEVRQGACTSRPYAEREHQRWRGIKWSYSFHGWSKQANTTLPHLWQEALDRKERNGWTDQHPVFVREDLGRWMADDSVLCYRFLTERNTWKPSWPGLDGALRSLPKGHQWKLVMGVDFGGGRTDKTAIEVAAYADSHSDVFHVYEFVATGVMSPTEIAEEVKRVSTVYELDYLVADFDSLGEAIAKQFRLEHGLFPEASKKKDKRDFIELMNGDLVEKRAWVIEGSVLARQMATLAWDETGIKEKSGQRNDAADAFVYTWRKCRHRFFEAKKHEPPKGSPEHFKKVEDEEIARLEDWENRKRFPSLYNDNPGDDVEWRWR